MDRRDLLTGAGIALASLAAHDVLAEDTKKGATSSAPTKHDALADVASACVAAGEKCLSHCIDALAAGDKSMASCAPAVRQMIAACRATATLAAAGSRHLKDFAQVCAKICADCEAECKKHEGHHAVCKACAEHCAKCAAECRKVV